MVKKNDTKIMVAPTTRGGNLPLKAFPQVQPSSRITRLVDDSTRFLHLVLHKKVEDHIVRQKLKKWIQNGIVLDGTR